MEGFLLKQGVRGPVKGFKKRWFKQKGTSLYYYKNQKDSQELGTICIGDALSCERIESRDGKMHFQIKTPKRIWHLCAENEEQLEYWVNGVSFMIIQQNKSNPPNRGSIRVETMENRIRDLEARQLQFEKALELAAAKLSTTVEQLLLQVEEHNSDQIDNSKEKSKSSEGDSKTDKIESNTEPIDNTDKSEEEISNSLEKFPPFQAKVLYNYSAQQDYEMTIVENEVITVLSKHGNGWWLGSSSNGNQGYFPGSYVEPL